jgi:hypothetical protein
VRCRPVRAKQPHQISGGLNWLTDWPQGEILLSDCACEAIAATKPWRTRPRYAVDPDGSEPTSRGEQTTRTAMPPAMRASMSLINRSETNR